MKTKFLLRIPSELKEKLAMAAARAGLSINAFVISVLWRYLREQVRGGGHGGKPKQEQADNPNAKGA